MSKKRKEPVVYLNGRFVPRSGAKLDIEDRGTMFADGVYEVIRYVHGKPLAMGHHLRRLKRSLAGIELRLPAYGARLGKVSDELVRRNGWRDASVYWQVTRGPAPRKHVYPDKPRPTVLAVAHPLPALKAGELPTAIAAILTPDVRWRLCSIKSLMLLPNVLAKNRAARAGAGEAIFERNGIVTEGSSTNVLIVRRGEVWTHPTDETILGGITRLILIREAKRMGITVREKRFTVRQLLTADEVMVSGTLSLVAGVTKVDRRRIGNGKVGPVTRRLAAAMIARIRAECA